jgi:rsbT co-antagonist protein RsbR
VALESRIDQILDVVTKIASGDFEARGDQTEQGDNLDAIMCAINMLAEELQSKFDEAKQLSEALVLEKENVIRAQAQAVLELSTPVIRVFQGVLVLPLIGTLDTKRAHQVNESLLRAIVQHKADVVIIDVTGVPVVDTRVANYFLHSVASCRLLGAEVILSGVSPHMALTLVRLGVDLKGMVTKGALEDALRTALHLTNMKLVPACE